MENTNIPWYKFLLKIKPDGKAFRSIKCTSILFEVMANAFEFVVNYANLIINDQIWYVNENFDPEPWEARYEIDVPEFATLIQRREVVRAYMLYPQSKNRLSRDYIQSSLESAGYFEINVEYNAIGSNDGFMRANDSADEKASFLLGINTYNSFIVSGFCSISEYDSIINLLLSMKPLQVAFYDKIQINSAIAIDDNFTLAIDDNFALALGIV